MPLTLQDGVLYAATLYLSRNISLDNPSVLYNTRICYVVAQVIILGCYYWTTLIIKHKDDSTFLRYAEAPDPVTKLPGRSKLTTFHFYDLAGVTKLRRSVYTAIAAVVIAHGYFKLCEPLLQSVMGFKGLFGAKVVAVHLLGKPAIGDQRPFNGATLIAEGPDTLG